MRQKLMELHIPGKESGNFFIIEQPSFKEPGFYRQGVSLDSFRSRELTRAFPDMSVTYTNGMDWLQYSKTKKYCSEHSPHPGRTLTEFLDSIGIDISIVPVCKSVWDFYDAINYDYKRKRYM